MDRGEFYVATPDNFVPEMTFGVEVEVILFWIQQKKGHDRDRLQLENPGAIIVPHEIADRTLFCRAHVISFLRSNGVDINDFNPLNGDSIPPRGAEKVPANAANSNEQEYHRWEFKTDASVDIWDEDELAMEDVISNGLEGVVPVGLELASPALGDERAAYEEIGTVVSLVRHNYRCTINDTCGLHVHVGMGPGYIPDEVIRRIAALLWALDPILSPLHPEDRQENAFAMQNRTACNLAYGMTGETANQIGNTELDLTIQLPVDLPESESSRCDIEQGVREILKCNEATAVARLMSDRGNKNMAYSFDSYTADGRRDRYKPTIEFRQGAGTLNTTWIQVWASICVRICEYAAQDMTEGDLEFIVDKCTRVESGDMSAAEVLYVFLGHIGLVEYVAYLRSTTPDQRANQS
ncbi:putative amidoligase [Xylariales sp. AK1849]|nr:putative amidoligase [Xylariales sp. AK1849]